MLVRGMNCWAESWQGEASRHCAVECGGFMTSRSDRDVRIEWNFGRQGNVVRLE